MYFFTSSQLISLSQLVGDTIASIWWKYCLNIQKIVLQDFLSFFHLIWTHKVFAMRLNGGKSKHNYRILDFFSFQLNKFGSLYKPRFWGSPGDFLCWLIYQTMQRSFVSWECWKRHPEQML